MISKAEGMINNLRDLAFKLNNLSRDQHMILNNALKALNDMGCGTATIVTATNDSYYQVGYQRVKAKYVFCIRHGVEDDWVPYDEATREQKYIVFGTLPALFKAIESNMEDILNRHTKPVEEVICTLRTQLNSLS